MIEILQGISGSGKSTYASLKGWSIVSRDELRKELLESWGLSLEDYFNQGMDLRLEDYITELEHKRIASHIIKHHNLIIDNTCLTKKYVDEYVNIFNDLDVNPKDVSIIKFDVPYEVCLDRVKKRDNKHISEEILRKQYDRFQSINWTIKDFIRKDTWKTTRDKRKWYFVDFDIDESVKKAAQTYNSKREDAIICDLDGTLAHRSVLSSPKIHMRNFYEAEECDTDFIDLPLFKVLLALNDSYDFRSQKLIFVTGRFERYRPQTEKFLQEFTKRNIGYQLYCRKNGDTRSDSVVKYEIYRDYLKDKYNILCVFDDRKRVLALWEELGIKTFNMGLINDDF